MPLRRRRGSPATGGFLSALYVYNNWISLPKITSCTHGGLTDNREEIKLRGAYNRVLRVSAAIIGSLFILAAIAEWVRSAYAPFQGLVPHYEWIQGVRNFFYLMGMFNILLIRYVVMRIYIAPGDIDFQAVVERLSRAGIASMLISALPWVFGLLLFLIAGDLVDFYLLFGLSVIYSMIYFPRFRSWVSLVQEKVEKDRE